MEVLEFWFNERGYGDNWQRDKTLERPLQDARYDEDNPLDLKPTVLDQIMCWKKVALWDEAVASSDKGTMVSILRQFNCEMPEEVARMVDLDETYSASYRALIASCKEEGA